jgi:hypothetical protein
LEQIFGWIALLRLELSLPVFLVVLAAQFLVPQSKRLQVTSASVLAFALSPIVSGLLYSDPSGPSWRALNGYLLWFPLHFGLMAIVLLHAVEIARVRRIMPREVFWVAMALLHVFTLLVIMIAASS